MFPGTWLTNACHCQGDTTYWDWSSWEGACSLHLLSGRRGQGGHISPGMGGLGVTHIPLT